jgi:hypothetical protein
LKQLPLADKVRHILVALVLYIPLVAVAEHMPNLLFPFRPDKQFIIFHAVVLILTNLFPAHLLRRHVACALRAEIVDIILAGPAEHALPHVQ